MGTDISPMLDIMFSFERRKKKAEYETEISFPRYTHEMIWYLSVPMQ